MAVAASANKQPQEQQWQGLRQHRTEIKTSGTFPRSWEGLFAKNPFSILKRGSRKRNLNLLRPKMTVGKELESLGKVEVQVYGAKHAAELAVPGPCWSLSCTGAGLGAPQGGCGRVRPESDKTQRRGQQKTAFPPQEFSTSHSVHSLFKRQRF